MPSQILKTNGAVAKESPALSTLMNAVKNSLPSDTSSQEYDREKLKDAAYNLTLALETPGDTVQRVGYYASAPSNSSVKEFPQCMRTQ